MMEKINRWVITNDNGPEIRKAGYGGITVIPIEDDLISELNRISALISGSKHQGMPIDVRTNKLKLNNVKLTGAFWVLNAKTITSGKINAQKNEIMRGWQLQDPEYKKPWWRFW